MDFETKEILETVLTILGMLFKVAFVIGALSFTCYLTN